MEFNNLKISSSLVPSNYFKLASQQQKSRNNKIEELLEKRKLPEEGWPDDVIETLVHYLASLDSNNFEHKAGLGEREARIACNLVARRHYNFGHGVGRSGDLLEAQPKAVGSTILSQLTNSLLLDLIRAMGVQRCKACFLVPMATGMTLALCLSSLRKQRPNAKYVLWSRIDQKSCFKSIYAAGFQAIVIPTKRIEGKLGLFTNLEAFESVLSGCSSYGSICEEILCIVSTTSCFAPRNSDDIVQLAELAKKYQLPHIVNNAYGLQSTYFTHQIQEAHRLGRLDLFVQSTDKNLMVPVGGAIVAGFEESIVHNVSKSYAGRASSSQSLDVLMTLLSLGRQGYMKLVKERKTNFQYLKTQLEEFAKAYNCSAVECKGNPISMALSLDGLAVTDHCKLGSMLYVRGISGARVVAPGCGKEINGYKFENWGSHEEVARPAYLTAASSLGMSQQEVDIFILKLKQCWKDIAKCDLTNI